MGPVVSPSLHQPRLNPFLQPQDHLGLGQLTPQRGQVPVVLQGHISVQGLLGGVQQLPLLPGKAHQHVLEGHQGTRWGSRQLGLHARLGPDGAFLRTVEPGDETLRGHAASAAHCPASARPPCGFPSFRPRDVSEGIWRGRSAGDKLSSRRSDNVFALPVASLEP